MISKGRKTIVGDFGSHCVRHNFDIVLTKWSLLNDNSFSILDTSYDVTFSKLGRSYLVSLILTVCLIVLVLC